MAMPIEFKVKYSSGDEFPVPSQIEIEQFMSKIGKIQAAEPAVETVYQDALRRHFGDLIL